MNVYTGLLNFLHATETDDDPKEIFVQLKDGRSAILHTLLHSEDESSAICKAASMSDGTTVSRFSFEQNDVVWGQVIGIDQLMSIIQKWKYDALLLKSNQENFPRAWEFLSHQGVTGSFAEHTIAHIRNLVRGSIPKDYDQYVLERLQNDRPYTKDLSPGHIRTLHDELKNIVVSEEDELQTPT